MDFSDDINIIAVTQGRNAFLVNPYDGSIKGILQGLILLNQGHTLNITFLIFVGSDFIVSGSLDRKVYFWNVSSLTPIAKLCILK